MNSVCYINGEYKDILQASVNVTDIGLLRGYGVYDGITSYNNVPFLLKEHLARFRNSAKALSLFVPHTDEEIERILLNLIERNKFPRTNFRLILTGGQTLNGIDFDKNKSTFYILAEKHSDVPKKIYEQGASLITDEYVRYLPQYKTINYIEGVMLQEKRKQSGAIEILFHKDGQVSEASTSNICIVERGQIVTPVKNILSGITKLITLKLAAKHGIMVKEEDVSLERLLKSDEVFITASFKEIVPIVKVDGEVIGQGVPGIVTKRLIELFSQFTQSYG